MELLLPEPPNPPIPGLQNAPPSGGSSSASGSQDIKPGTGSMEIPRLYDLKLTSMTDDTRARNLYAFRERVEGATGLNSDSGLGADEEGDDVGKGKGKAGEGSAPPSKGRRKYRSSPWNFRHNVLNLALSFFGARSDRTEWHDHERSIATASSAIDQRRASGRFRRLPGFDEEASDGSSQAETLRDDARRDRRGREQYACQRSGRWVRKIEV